MTVARRFVTILFLNACGGNDVAKSDGYSKRQRSFLDGRLPIDWRAGGFGGVT